MEDHIDGCSYKSKKDHNVPRCGCPGFRLGSAIEVLSVRNRRQLQPTEWVREKERAARASLHLHPIVQFNFHISSIFLNRWMCVIASRENIAPILSAPECQRQLWRSQTRLRPALPVPHPKPR